MRTRKTLVWKAWTVCGLVLFCWVGLGACGTTTPKEPTWSELTAHDDKLTFMGTKVYGPMKDAFAAFDNDKYGQPAGEKPKFQCENCHGQDSVANNYKMPGAVALDANNFPTESHPQLGKYVKFMTETVVPMMQKILGKQDLSCFTCHTKK